MCIGRVKSGIGIRTVVSIWCQIMLEYLLMDIICSDKQIVLIVKLEEIGSFEEQIMSKDRYPNIFLKANGCYSVYYPSNIFCSIWNLGNITWILPSFSWSSFSDMTCLDQLHAS